MNQRCSPAERGKESDYEKYRVCRKGYSIKNQRL